LPQLPQLFGSAIGSVQIDPVGLAHILGLSGVQVVPPPLPHRPLWQLTPAGQAWPQPPQFCGSLPRFVQYGVAGGPQVLGCEGGQVGPPPQVPFWQAMPAAQVLPQPPQLAASVIGSAQ
jgi:hypothetical protein